MPSSNQKRVTELESQLEASQQKVRQLQAEKSRLTVALQHLAHNPAGLTLEQLQAAAQEALDDTRALEQLQQRDLAVAHSTVSRMRFPTNLRKQWSGTEVQNWLQQFAEVLRLRAQAQLEQGKQTLQ